MKGNALLIKLLVAAALIVLVTYIAHNTYWDEITIPMPLQGEAITNPFYAAEKFATELGATTEWRQTLGTLPKGNAVIVLSNWHWDLIETRRKQLEAWVAQGGRLVVDRTLIGGEDKFENWSGIRREYPDYDDAGEDEAPTEDATDADASSDEPAEDDEVLCNELRIVIDDAIADSRDTMSICTLDDYTYLGTDRSIAWGLRDESDALEAVRVRIGRGSVTAINAIPFGNRELTEMDHGELFVAATQLHRGDRVLFISEREHPSLLSLMWTYGAPVVVLTLLMLAALLWRGAVRFGPLGAPTDTARRSLAEQIRGTGQFTIRLGGGRALHAASVRALYEAASRKIAGYPSLAQPERLAAIAKIGGVDAEALANAVNHSGARRPAELAQVITLIETARRKLLE